MKRFVLGLVGAVLVASSFALSATQGDGVMRRLSDGTYVVNTTSLCANVRGFKGATPLEVYILKGKVVRVVPLANQETPRYFQKVRAGLMDKWNGMSVSKVAKANVDGITGATFSSKAVKANVQAAAQYYKKNK